MRSSARSQEVHHLVALLADVELAVDADVPMGDRLELRRPLGPVALVGLGQRLAVDDVQRGVEQQQEPGAAGVDDAGVLEHRQQLGRAGRAPRRPASRAARSTVDQRRARRPPPPSAASALSRTTVRIVPSTGLQHRLVGGRRRRRRARRRPWPPSTSAVALAASTARPRRIWQRITPLLPRAPISEPWLMASHVGASSAGAPSSSATTASSVRAMLVPVSPSGTGYTLSRLMPAWWARTTSRNVVTVSRRACDVEPLQRGARASASGSYAGPATGAVSGRAVA